MTFRLNDMGEFHALQERMKRRDVPVVPCEAPRKSKYNAEITEAMGLKFRSKKEARYYLELVCRQKAGEIIYFHWQVPIRLPGNTKYIVDFQEFHADGTVHYVDTKGCRTDAFIKNKKQVEALYPIKIEEV